jgi:hypothetical protein
MSAEQGARLFVKILVERGCEVGVPIQNAIVQVWAVEAGLDGSDLDDALNFAGEKEWIENEGQEGTFNLTQAGHAAGSADA